MKCRVIAAGERGEALGGALRIHILAVLGEETLYLLVFQFIYILPPWVRGVRALEATQNHQAGESVSFSDPNFVLEEEGEIEVGKPFARQETSLFLIDRQYSFS